MVYINFDKKILEKVEKITGVNYKTNATNLVDVNDINCMLYDLLLEIDYLKETNRNLKEDMRDNYKRVTQEEQL